jgi:hypothetical protein
VTALQVIQAVGCALPAVAAAGVYRRGRTRDRRLRVLKIIQEERVAFEAHHEEHQRQHHVTYAPYQRALRIMHCARARAKAEGLDLPAGLHRQLEMEKD